MLLQQILLGFTCTVAAVFMVWFIVKMSRDHTSKEIEQLTGEVHKGVGQIELLIRQTNQQFDINARKKSP